VEVMNDSLCASAQNLPQVSWPGKGCTHISSNTRLASLRVLRLFSILDIGAGAVPPHDVAGFVAERLGANKEPPVNAVMAAKSRLNLIGFSGSQHLRPFFH